MEAELALAADGAGITAFRGLASKGRGLGIFKPHQERAKKAREKERGERFWIEEK